MKIAIVEISESHEECIYTQVKFLTDSGHSVHLILNPVLEAQIKGYKHLCHSVFYLDPIKNGIVAKLAQQIRLVNILKGYDKIIFNTASSSKLVRNLAFFLIPYKVECIGILHNTRKLRASFTQRIISLKVKKYFVLNEYLMNPDVAPKRIRLQYFYPIYFPYRSKSKTVEKQNIWIGIPGRIDPERRNYGSLITCLSDIGELKRTKFLILGKLDVRTEAGKILMDCITNNHLDRHFILFDHFIANENYHEYLRASDYIMPLLKSENDYLEHKISGSFNLAFAYQKPLICNSYFEKIPDLKENSYFYDEESLGSLLIEIDRGQLAQKNLYRDKKWNYGLSRKRYVDFVLS